MGQKKADEEARRVSAEKAKKDKLLRENKAKLEKKAKIAATADSKKAAEIEKERKERAQKSAENKKKEEQKLVQREQKQKATIEKLAAEKSKLDEEQAFKVTSRRELSIQRTEKEIKTLQLKRDKMLKNRKATKADIIQIQKKIDADGRDLAILRK